MPHNHLIDISGAEITTDRIRLRPWTEADAEPALAVFGTEAVARWLAPAMTSVPDADAMREVLRGWAADDASMPFQSPQRAFVSLRAAPESLVRAQLVSLLCIRRPEDRRSAAPSRPPAVHHGASDVRLPGLHPPLGPLHIYHKV